MLAHPLGCQAKDQAYVKERIEHTRSDKEKEALKNELMRIKKLVSTAETTMKNYQAEVRPSLSFLLPPVALPFFHMEMITESTRPTNSPHAF